ncbi:MAG TPA: ankyrin repeat domain-containing protein [Thermoanaerobaculia bacterium]|nr:ankyrin repeat domain-containing protein [Thermoanaerobaculia bacterium]
MKRLGLAVAFVLLCAATAAGAMTRAQAKKVIAEHGLPETADGMLAMLNTSGDTAPLVVEAYLTLGTRADREITYLADGQQTLTRYPLTYLLMFSCADDTTAAMAKLLVDAGADPNTTDPENDSAALSQAYACPDVIRVLLDAPKKPDVNRVDRNGNTAMHLVVRIGGDRQVESIRMLLDAGFDIAKWRNELLKDARNNAPVVAALGGKPATPALAPAPRPASAGRVDWKALPPYPERTPAEAKKMLERPGAVTTIDEHMWDGITRREPLRLALALKAGADIRQTREVTGFTPLVILAERCDLKDAEIQTANAELLTGAGADLAGVDRNGANALVLAADSCPSGVVRALLAAGVSPHVRAKNDNTALRNAIEDKRADVVEMLLEAGVDPKKEPYNVRALASGNSEIEALLRKKRPKR